MPNKSEKLKKLLELVNEGLTREEFLKSFKQVINQVLKIETQALKKINTAIKGLEDGNNTSNKAILDDFKGLKAEVDIMYKDTLKDLKDGLNFLEKKAKKIKSGKDGTDGINGSDGKDADEEKIIKEVLDKIEIPEKEIGIEEVGGLRNELEELRKIKTKGGGGNSAIAIANAAKYFIKTEKPGGTIDGTNKAFTVSKPRIFAILSMSLNGEHIAQLPNYTITGNTITFSEAIPSSYSGKDWEIVYI